MNCNNTNQKLGFDKFSECNYNLHWSFSNFNRMLMAAGQIARLPKYSKVLELGAGSSELENIVHKNFKRDDIGFYKIDGDKIYENEKGITVMDIASDDCDKYCKESGPFDAVVFMEVIEHLNSFDAYVVISRIYDWLKGESILLLTTPTPPESKRYEDKVWPEDHDFEFSHREIYNMVNQYFKVVKEIGWSLEEREYNKLLESDSNLALIRNKLRVAFPESYIRAIMACLSPVSENRQVLFICKKRRKVNG